MKTNSFCPSSLIFSALPVMLSVLSAASCKTAVAAQDLDPAQPRTVTQDTSFGDVRGLNEPPKSHVGPPGKIQVKMSSWSLSNYQEKSQVADVTSYQASSVPEISIGYLSPEFLFTPAGSMRISADVGYRSMNRQGSFGFQGGTESGQETLNLFPVSVGPQWVAPFEFFNCSVPYVGASFLSVIAMNNQTLLSDNASQVGIGALFEAGTATNLGMLSSFVFGTSRANIASAPELDLGVEKTVGQINSSSLAGFGIRAGVTISL